MRTVKNRWISAVFSAYTIAQSDVETWTSGSDTVDTVFSPMTHKGAGVWFPRPERRITHFLSDCHMTSLFKVSLCRASVALQGLNIINTGCCCWCCFWGENRTFSLSFKLKEGNALKCSERIKLWTLSRNIQSFWQNLVHRLCVNCLNVFETSQTSLILISSLKRVKWKH